MQSLSIAMQNYLETVFDLSGRCATNCADSGVRVSDIAAKLDVSKASVNNAMNTLAKLGYVVNEKYQEMGGVVSLRRIADALYRHATRRDLERLGRMVTLAVAIGNTDMHAKNLGLLHLDDGVRLAPAYDFVPQAHLTIDGRMALAVNGRYRLAELTREDLAAELGGWGLRAPADLVDETLEEAAVAIGRETPVAGAFTGLQESLAVATDRLRSARSPAARRSKSQAGSIWTK